MKRSTRLTTALVTIPLAVAACGTANPASAPNIPVGAGSSPVDARTYASTLLGKVVVPPGAVRQTHSPTKAVDTLPERPSLIKPPTVETRYWTVNESAAQVDAWLGTHAPRLTSSGSGASGTSDSMVRFRSYDVRTSSLPRSIALGQLYVVVAPMGATKSAIAAFAVTLAPPTKPVAEYVSTPDTVVVGWRLGPGGTPVRKTLTGLPAAALANEFNALPLALQNNIPCPMQIPDNDVSLTFTSQGHTWKANVATCPGIGVTRDGQQLQTLDAAPAFLNDLKALGVRFNSPGGPGGVTPLMQTGGH